MTDIPEIRIGFSSLLYHGESRKLGDPSKLKSIEEYQEKTRSYRDAWRQHEQKILTGLQEVLGVKFYLPVIDVACAPYFVPKSYPLIMNMMHEPDQFVDVLTHELCHVLLNDNTKLTIVRTPRLNLMDEWLKLFGDSFSRLALVHIPVHALLKFVYLDVLKEPTRLDRDVEFHKKIGGVDYVAAWDYVSSHDYKKIIEDLGRIYEVKHES